LKESLMAHYDRKAEDLGNITMLEHVNLQIPDQSLGTLFYVQGLGLTRDPYMNTGLANMWINVGKSQFHLPTGEPWVLRGAIGLVTPDRDALLKRLDSVKKQLADTKFKVSENNAYVEVICPWGNVFNMHSPDEARFGAINLGMPYLQFDVPAGTAKGIARFYDEIFGAQTKMEGNGSGKTAVVSVGYKQELRFKETQDAQKPYDGHHIQVYVRDFSGPYEQLVKRELLTEESNAYQYRWENIVDVATNETLFEIEHEIRSMTHPLYARPLINRNPAQSQQSYQMGGDAWDWETRRANPRLDVPAPTGASAAAYQKRRAARMAGM
jgi:catechol-2,3-dioxygenase